MKKYVDEKKEQKSQALLQLDVTNISDDKDEDMEEDKFTFAVVLKVSEHCLMIGTGGSLHYMAVKSGFGSDLHVNNTILRMYAGLV
ncbi:hypothetical protein H5410_002017 [Solanum commersonii]|uniref:Uncharacterized protein n=1 Tax=Solanum commersonii TaxID=4109 RepID=A0A9J6B0V9_SOLCO|nr:hypothetical protein H5410_002017 [Solanum commersonii]